MAETEEKSFSGAYKLLALLPLLLMGAGVWYYIYGRAPSAPQEPAAAQAVFGAFPEAPAAAPQADAARPPEAYDPKAVIEIQGSPEFKAQVTHALKLIWLSDRGTFLFLKKNLSIIRNEDQTGFYLDGGRPVAALSKDHAFRSLTWCAGVIAHQGWHAGYTLNKKKKNRPAPPLPGEKYVRELDLNPVRADYKELDDILAVEAQAFAYQLDVLKKVGAPGKETDLVFRRGPRDFQYAHDGTYALNP